MLSGGAGSDIFLINKGFGTDLILDFSSDDVVRLAGLGFTSFDAVKAAMTDTGSDLHLAFGDGQGLVLANTDLADLSASQFELGIDMSKLNGKLQVRYECQPSHFASPPRGDDGWATLKYDEKRSLFVHTKTYDCIASVPMPTGQSVSIQGRVQVDYFVDPSKHPCLSYQASQDKPLVLQPYQFVSKSYRVYEAEKS
ncbi:MAG: calcium-binding protein [Proteobacteria bacterium]|nr:MAG: calcium-binding protein [Pseudomonadota bacterium]